MLVGFTWGGWTTGGTAQATAKKAATGARQELAAVLCVDRFKTASDATAPARDAAGAPAGAAARSSRGAAGRPCPAPRQPRPPARWRGCAPISWPWPQRHPRHRTIGPVGRDGRRARRWQPCTPEPSEERHGPAAYQQPAGDVPSGRSRCAAIDGVQPPGTYTVETEEELIEGLSFPAYRRKATVMLLPALEFGENRLAPDRHDRPAGAAGRTGEGRKGQLARIIHQA